MCLAVPGQIEEVYVANGVRMGKVNFGGIVKDVCLAYVPEIGLGDYTIVHVGFAISKIDEASALETLRLFEEMGILQEELREEPAEPSDSSDQVCYVQPGGTHKTADPEKP